MVKIVMIPFDPYDFKLIFKTLLIMGAIFFFVIIPLAIMGVIPSGSESIKTDTPNQY